MLFWNKSSLGWVIGIWSKTYVIKKFPQKKTLQCALCRRENEILRRSKRRWKVQNLYFYDRVGSNSNEQALQKLKFTKQKCKNVWKKCLKCTNRKKYDRISLPLKSSCKIRQTRNDGSSQGDLTELNHSSCKKFRYFWHQKHQEKNAVSSF